MGQNIHQQTFSEHFYLAFRFSINGLSPNLFHFDTPSHNRVLAMAPGLVDPPQPWAAPNPLKPLTGPEEAFIGGPRAYDNDREVNGTDKQPPATHPNYLPVWDAETK